MDLPLGQPIQETVQRPPQLLGAKLRRRHFLQHFWRKSPAIFPWTAGGKMPQASGAGKKKMKTKRPAVSAPSKNDPCGASFKCGACQHIAKPYDQQLQAKGEYVHQLFVNAGIVTDDAAATESIFLPVLGMDEPSLACGFFFAVFFFDAVSDRFWAIGTPLVIEKLTAILRLTRR